MLILSLALLALFLCLLPRIGASRLAAATLGIALFLLLALDLVALLSWFLGAEEFDESVVYHVVSGYRGVPKSILLPVLAATVICAALFALACAWSYRRLRRHPRSAGRTAVAGALLLASLGAHPVATDLASSAYFHFSASAARPAEYQLPAGVQFSDKPNVVYIYLESLERTYLDDKRFPGLAPNLRALESQALAFSNIQQTYGTGWTMAGMVASQCGIPLSTDIWNSMAGLGWFLPGATCLGDVLADQGYALTYLGGADMAFAGKGNFYRSHRFAEVEGEKELAPLLHDPAYQNTWGLYDDTLFGLFVQRFDQLATAGQPFGLFTLTNGTHAPDGNPPATCGHYGDGSDHILDAVHCTDRYVGAVVRHIRASSAGANTIIVIGSDHLAMRSRSAERWLHGQERRDLLMILAPHSAPALIAKPGTTLDAAPTLLALFSNVRALGFGRDLRSGNPALLQSKANLRHFLKSTVRFLNTFWNFPALSDGVTIHPAEGFVAVQSEQVRIPALFLLDDGLQTKDIVFPGRNDFAGLSGYVARLGREQPFLWIDHCGELAWLGGADLHWDDTRFCTAAGSLADARVAVTRLGADGAQPLDARALANAPAAANGDPPLYKKKAAALDRIRRWSTANLERLEFNAQAGSDYTVAAGADPGRPSFIENRKKKLEFTQGLTVFQLGRDADAPKVRYAATCDESASSANPARLGPNALKDLSAQGGDSWVVVMTPLWDCQKTMDAAPFAAFPQLRRWGKRAPDDVYVGIVSKSGKAAEYLIPPGTALALQVTAADHGR